MGWEKAVTVLAENWAVIWNSLPLILILVGLVAWVAFRLGQAYNDRELRNERGLRALAEKGEAIAKDSVKALEKKLAEVTPRPEKSAPPADVVAVVTGEPVIRQAFEELVSTRGLHLPADPRPDRFVQFGNFLVNKQEIERMAAARYFVDRGLIALYTPDATGTGVTVTASTTAVSTYATLPKASPEEKA